MITSTSLKNPNYLARVKAAILRAVEKANRRSPDGRGYADVYNRRGEASLEIVAYRGKGLTILADDVDVTEIVMKALREWHKTKALPLAVVEYDTGPVLEMPACA